MDCSMLMNKKNNLVQLESLNDAVIQFDRSTDIVANSKALALFEPNQSIPTSFVEFLSEFGATQKSECIYQASNENTPLMLTKIVDLDGVLLVKLQKAEEKGDIAQYQYEQIIHDYLEMSHENIMFWELKKPLNLTVPLTEKLIHLKEHLRLRKIIKSVSGYLANMDHEKLIGRKATELFNLESPEMLEALKRFFDEDLFIREVKVPVESPLTDELLTFSFTWKGYQENGYLMSALLASQNITSSVKQQKELELTRAMLIESEKVGRQAAWSYWPEKKDSWFSDNFYQLLGLKKSDGPIVEQIKHHKLITQEDAATVRESLKNIVIEGNGTLTFTMKRVDGVQRYFKLIAKLEHNLFGQDPHISGVIRDVSEEIELQNKLSRKNLEWELFSETVPGGFFQYKVFKDGSVSVPMMTRKAYEVMGIPNDVPNDQALEYYVTHIHPEDLPDYYESIEYSLENLSIWNHKHRFKQSDGSFKWIKGISSPALDEDRNITFYGLILDITEEEQIASELVHSNRKYKLATETARLGIWDLDLNTNQVTWDRELHHLYRTNDKDIVTDYRFWFESIHPDDRDWVQGEFQKAINGEKDYDLTYRVIIDGEVFYHKVKSILVYDQAGKPVSMLGVTWDVTETMLYQKELEKASLKYKLAAKTAKMGLWTLEIETGKTIWDEGLYQILGLEPGSVSKYSDWSQRVHPDDLVVLEEHLKLAIQGIREYDETFRYLLPNGEYGYNKTKAILQKNETGKAAVLHGVSWDVSDEIKYQRDLEEANLKYSMAISSQRVALWDYNPLTGQILAERGFIEMFGIACKPGERFHVSEVLKVIDQRDRDHVFNSFKEAIETKKEEFVADYTIHNPIDNRTRHIEIVCSPQLNQAGEVERMIGLAFDITERVEKENELGRVLETREKLFSVIAHDLKGPISNLIGVSTLLLDDFESLSKEEISEFINMIRRSSTSASDLLKNLLTWSRNISNRIPYNPSKISLNEEIRQVVDFYAETAKLKDIDINYVEPSFEANIFADQQMINTVLRNLLANAIKFTHSGGQISFQIEENSEGYLLKIQDDGIGMNAEQIDSIIKKEGKIQRPGTSKEKGTGLGLIIVQDFLNRHKTSLNIQSQADVGSEFSIQFAKV